MMIRVKLVIMRMIAGRNDSDVSIKRVWMLKL
jgi:hypothetical protein